MEIIVAVVIAFAAFQWGASSVDSEQQVTQVEISEVAEEVEPDQSTQYVRENGYYIKDLTVQSAPPEGCNRPVLTTDLSSAAKDGVRNVTEVSATCEG